MTTQPMGTPPAQDAPTQAGGAGASRFGSGPAASPDALRALLAVRAHGARILDDRSANGTHVNGRRISEAELTDGDVIVLGRVVLSYVEIA